MARAILLVMDSVGIGGAAGRATSSATRAPTRSAISPPPARPARADVPGGRSGPLAIPVDEPPRHRPRRRGLDRHASGRDRARSRSRRRSGAMPAKCRRARTRNPAIGSSPACRCRSQWGYFPDTIPAFPPDLTDALIREAKLPGILGNKHASGTGDHRGVRRGAHPDRQADLLHLRRFGHADLRARGAFRAGAALRGLPHRPQALRPAPHRPRDRPPLRRRDASDLQAHRQPQGFCHPAARARPCSTSPRRADARFLPSARSPTSSPAAASPEC